MPDLRSESGRMVLLATLLDYPGSFALECAKCPNPKCGSRETQVVNIRQVGEVARRRRECEKCGTRFTTWERIAPGKSARIVPKG